MSAFVMPPQPLPRILNLKAYVQGKSQLPGTDCPIKLSSNECCFGPSPLAVEAYHRAADELHRYPDGSQADLRAAISSAHELDAERIVCGNGSEELIGLLTRCYVGEGDEVLLSENNFVMCAVYARAQGATVVLAPEQNFHVDIDEMLARVTPKTKLVAVANPNNPTGTCLDANAIQRLVENVPSNVIVLLDGAYAEYVESGDYDSGSRWVEKRENVVMTRTFSKIYGLAGLRIGWAYAPAAIISTVNRLRTPFNASGPAMAAAVAGLGDVSHVTRVREHNSRSLDKLVTEIKALGLPVVPSVANFYLIDFNDVAGRDAAAAAAFLESRSIIPRPGGAGGMLRITVGTDSENSAVIAALRDFLRS